jgi:hypothetical protein
MQGTAVTTIHAALDLRCTYTKCLSFNDSFHSVIQDYFISYAHIQVSASTNTIQQKSNKEETGEVQYLATNLRLLAWRGHLSPAAPAVKSAQPIWQTETRM